jgi:hypothetical protein
LLMELLDFVPMLLPTHSTNHTTTHFKKYSPKPRVPAASVYKCGSSY